MKSIPLAAEFIYLATSGPINRPTAVSGLSISLFHWI